jgi:hypothetical protein
LRHLRDSVEEAEWPQRIASLSGQLVRFD